MGMDKTPPCHEARRCSLERSDSLRSTVALLWSSTKIHAVELIHSETIPRARPARNDRYLGCGRTQRNHKQKERSTECNIQIFAPVTKGVLRGPRGPQQGGLPAVGVVVAVLPFPGQVVPERRQLLLRLRHSNIGRSSCDDNVSKKTC